MKLVNVWGKSATGRGYSMSKGPETGCHVYGTARRLAWLDQREWPGRGRG